MSSLEQEPNLFDAESEFDIHLVIGQFLFSPGHVWEIEYKLQRPQIIHVRYRIPYDVNQNGIYGVTEIPLLLGDEEFMGSVSQQLGVLDTMACEFRQSPVSWYLREYQRTARPDYLEHFGLEYPNEQVKAKSALMLLGKLSTSHPRMVQYSDVVRGLADAVLALKIP